MIGVLFVCMGNICRSPTAEAVFRKRCERARLSDRVLIDSAGTHGYHEGCAPDSRATAIARARGYELSDIRSRLLVPADFHRFDYLLGMDRHNLRALDAMRPAGHRGYVGRLLDFAPHLGLADIEDPFYAAQRDFELVLDQIEAAADGLLGEIERRLALRA
jgi:protein-tyrosine phosphatase